jgi:hypothetical protein
MRRALSPSAWLACAALGVALACAAGWWPRTAPGPVPTGAAMTAAVAALPLPAAHPAAIAVAPLAAARPSLPAVAPPLYARNGRALELGGLTLAQYLDARSTAARQGDLRAGYETYHALSVCALRDEALPEFRDPAEREALRQERAELARQCAAVSPAQVQERMRFLAAAAAAGNPAAQIDFYMEGPSGRPYDADRAADDPAVRAWKAEALAHLRDAAAHCDRFAMGLLSTLHDTGTLAEPDPALSAVYAVAAAAARHRAVTEAALQEQFGEALGAAQLAAARQQGERLAAACGP